MNEYTNHYPPPIPDSYAKIRSMKPQKSGVPRWVFVVVGVVVGLVALGAVAGGEDGGQGGTQQLVSPETTETTTTTTTTTAPTTTTTTTTTLPETTSGVARSIISMTEHGYNDNDIEEMVLQYVLFGDALRTQTAQQLITMCNATKNMGRQEALDFIKNTGPAGQELSHPQLVGTALALDEACGRP